MGRTRRVRPMVPQDLTVGPGTCRGHGGLDPLLHDPQALWARSAQDQWGLCGIAVLDEHDEVLAQLMVCPVLQLPAGHPLEHWSKTPDSACLLALVTTRAEGERPEHLVKLMVQHLARRLVGQAGSVVALGLTQGGSCLQPPAAWLEEAGFQRVEEHRVDGCRRLELRLDATARWQPDLNRAWQLLAGLVPRPLPPAEPTGREAGRSR
ncbi:hypothetical protein [Luteococcus peritonei]|uniref:GNAT family N-acetyltransferase n=1 Tax=Luteococcus peritonei TaxID=88874 RepID=A0ABW4S050_9ACTN